MSDYRYPFKSIPEMLRESARKYADKTAIMYKKEGKYISLSYRQVYYRTLQVSRGLKKMGIKPKDKVAILSETRPMWVLADFGILNIGAIEIPIYHTDSPEQIAYIINHSEAKAIFVSNKAQYMKLLQVRDKIPSIEFVIAHDRFLGNSSLPVYTLFQVSEISEELSEKDQKEIEDFMDTIEPDDIYTILYTSGTTGNPKGVLLTHKNIISNVHNTVIKAKDFLGEDEIFLTFLPFSHVLGKTDSCYLPIYTGGVIAFAESIDTLADNMKEVKPTVIVTVPRLLEKIHARINNVIHEMPPSKKKLIQWAINTGIQYIKDKYIERKNPSTFKYNLADKLVFEKLRKVMGLERLKGFVSGGAPLDKDLNIFFWALGLRVFEGYGLTETSPVLCVNTPTQLKFGSVGTLIDETEVKVAEDGELLFRGPQIAKGYYKMPEATEEAFSDDGWFKTGDIGKIDSEGFIYITDRKKELIITAGGKNIAPQPIENMLKMSEYISNACLYGDRRPYIVALLTLNMERIIDYAKEHHLKYFDIKDLAKNEKILQLIKNEVEKVNKNLARVETIKKFAILQDDFSIEGGELTSTLKLKRRVIYKKYWDIIECLYAEDGSCYKCSIGSQQNG
ncbi:AMP-dependent synthetase/ligase [Hippea jasoniae]|uniref:AMP-dependent synthetase/ligase n=1 Tax=Hippea jasoniae TaxID=944479 RepID=UPI0018DB3115|nr:long-chain fatty acid--CoA ligase [Hippea jasoniae]